MCYLPCFKWEVVVVGGCRLFKLNKTNQLTMIRARQVTEVLILSLTIFIYLLLFLTNYNFTFNNGPGVLNGGSLF